MGWLIVVVGALAALICFAEGVSSVAISAPQQTVQELFFVNALLGLVIVAVGAAILRIDALAAVVGRHETPRDEERPQVPPARAEGF